MTEHRPAGSDPAPTTPKARPIASSLFGGAILATVATVSMTQTYVPTVIALNGSSIASGTYVALGGYTVAGDGGGGVLTPRSTLVAACAPDNGIVFKDVNNNCFVRANPTNSVREWGAVCDVTVVTPSGSGTISWVGGSPGTLTVTSTLLSPPPVPSASEYIAISQIGVPTMWGSSTPSVSMTRFSTLSNTGTNYLPGDLISFAGGTFSQQVAIIVDAVDGAGAITQWHFLWGGVYQASNPPAGPMAQDDSRSYCGAIAATGSLVTCGTATGQAGGATMSPAWSGWSVLDKQAIVNAGSNYAVGDIVTMGIGDTFVNQGHYAKLVVEGTTTSGGTTGMVTAYDWLDYGSFVLTSVSNTGTLVQRHSSGGGNGLSFSPVAWTQAPFVTTISNLTSTSGSGVTTIVLADTPAFPGTFTSGVAIQEIYYGHDDATALTRAIQAAPDGGLVIPAGCGTTKALNLSVAANATLPQNANVFLKGANLQSTGIYAFAPAPSARSPSSPILAHIIYSGLQNSAHTGFLTTPGGGFSNMVVEGLGIPEGYGYYGLFQNHGTPTGYLGPTFSTNPYALPTAGNLVEIDAASQMRIDKVLIRNGGIGPGNSLLQCGMDEADPGHSLQTQSIANIALTDSRIDDNFTFSGPTNPDFVLRLEPSCHDSAYVADTIYDGTKADILTYIANLFSRVHINSDAANTTTGLQPTIPWTALNASLAGNADYGFYVIGNAALSETQCDVANTACVFTIPNPVASAFSPSQFTDTQMKCGSFANTPPGRSAIELGAGTANTTVAGTVAAPQCTIQPFQLVSLDGPVDPSTSFCGNSDAAIVGCTGYQSGFAAGQSFTQPAVVYTTATALGTGLYAVPFFSPAGGGTATKLSLNVTSIGGASQCLVGIYTSLAQKPSTLVSIGTLSTTGAPVGAYGTLTVSIGNLTANLPTPGAELAPGTLYFLAVGCNGTPTVYGVVAPGGLSVPLVGAQSRTDTASGIVAASWTYPTVTIALPASFPTPISRTTGAWVPNVYVKP